MAATRLSPGGYPVARANASSSVVTRLGPGGYPAAALVVIPVPPPAPTTGTLAVTEADDTLSAAGHENVTGALTATEEDDSLASDAGPIVTGALAKTEDNDTLAAAGSEAITGALAVTEANDTLAAAGTVATSTTTRDIDVTLTKEQLEAYLRERRKREKKRFEDFAKEGRKGDDIRQSLESFFEEAEPAEVEAIKAELPVLADESKAPARRPRTFVDRVDWKTLETSKETLARINAAVAEYARYHEKLRVEAERRAREEEDEADVEFLLLSM